ncbi:MAG: glycoside hydrolase family 13 protein [Clostridia bacterium]|nr:glycoside hydrolase family 13 protein [Clostridia bacterium]
MIKKEEISLDYFPFNSKNPLHKSRYGALMQGEKVTFRLIFPRYLCVSGVYLVINLDGNEEKETVSLLWQGMQGDSEEWWITDYTPSRAGLYWYYFEYDTPSGRNKITCMEKGIGVMTDAGKKWQLTVYGKDFLTPEWVKGGIIYQIFPDRFCFSGSKKENVPGGRVMHESWREAPEWKPDRNGVVRNNDFFGGDFEGITQKLGYLEELGVSIIYLNPIFESHSNHRYDTADYEKTDPLLGTEKDFKRLCSEAHKHGISVILDGVFSHTGADSRYFNKYGRYENNGAYNTPSSPFFSWYNFKKYPEKYSCWWNFDTLPEVNETDKSYLEYITGENGIARRWLRCGAKGWRLDVADELPDGFLDEFSRAVKAENPDALILGEVWEDASNKISYSSRRRYLLGGQLDSVMNYPFADAVLQFVKTGVAEGFSDKILSVLENYPPQVVNVLMNHIGTHDTCRAITYLAGNIDEQADREKQSEYALTDEQYLFGIKLMKLASLIQYTLPGVPSLYYGDEAGAQGCRDPFNRGTYPWGRENKELLKRYRELGQFRRSRKEFTDGKYETVSEMLSCLCFERIKGDSRTVIIVNRNDHPIDYTLPVLDGEKKIYFDGTLDGDTVHLEAFSGAAVTVTSFAQL